MRRRRQVRTLRNSLCSTVFRCDCARDGDGGRRCAEHDHRCGDADVGLDRDQQQGQTETQLGDGPEDAGQRAAQLGR